MILPIGNAIPSTLLQEILKQSEQNLKFADGRNTAGWHARQVKHNHQASQSPELNAIFEKVSKALLAHELVQAAARPRHIVSLLLSRYSKGMSYGTHVDDAMINGARTDLSFTLFLNEPGQYEGGELIIDDPSAERPFKLNAGNMLLYPSNTLHRVKEVSAGERLVIVGWIRSLVRDPGQREVLFDLDRTIAAVRNRQESADLLPLLLKSRSNLMRMWMED